MEEGPVRRLIGAAATPGTQPDTRSSLTAPTNIETPVTSEKIACTGTIAETVAPSYRGRRGGLLEHFCTETHNPPENPLHCQAPQAAHGTKMRRLERGGKGRGIKQRKIGRTAKRTGGRNLTGHRWATTAAIAICPSPKTMSI